MITVKWTTKYSADSEKFKTVEQALAYITESQKADREFEEIFEVEYYGRTYSLFNK